MTYWVSDPQIGRLFRFDVTYFGPTDDDGSDAVPWTEPYDLIVEYLRWEQPGDE